MQKHLVAIILPAVACFILFACNSKASNSSTEVPISTQDTFGQPVADYIVDAFRDSKGNIWFGSMSKGAIRYDGKSFTYFTVKDGLPINAVVKYTEDDRGNIIMNTQNGICVYDGNTFQTYGEKQGLPHFRTSNSLIDSRGNHWIGTWGGVCRFNRDTFYDFPLPNPDVKLESYQTTQDWITEIIEDKNTDMWFSRDGYGMTRFDGVHFKHLTKKDGLPSNNVQEMYVDKAGNIWIGCRVAERDHPDPEKRHGAGGLAKYDGKTITTFPDIPGLHNSDIYLIEGDSQGNIWIGSSGFGLFKYDGKKFTLYDKVDRPDLTYSKGFQAFLEDPDGKHWIGMSGGLFRLVGDSIVHFPK